MECTIINTTNKLMQATPKISCIKPGLLLSGRSHYVFTQTASRVAISTAARAASSIERPNILGLDPNHVNDVMTSINSIELVLRNLQSTQERQRQLLHVESDTLIPSRNSRMNILFQEAGLQQSIILKCLNNIKVNLIDAEKPLISRLEEEN